MDLTQRDCNIDKTTSVIKIALQSVVAFILCNSICSHIKEVDFRVIHSPLVIQVNRANPPYIALRDSTLKNESNDSLLIKSRPTHQLVAGELNVLKFNSFRRQELPEVIVSRRVVLPAMTIEVERIPNEFKRKITRFVLPELSVEGTKVTLSQVSKDLEEFNQTNDWTKKLRESLRQRVEMASQRGADLSFNALDFPSTESIVRNLIKAEAEANPSTISDSKFIESEVPGSQGITVLAVNDQPVAKTQTPSPSWPLTPYVPWRRTGEIKNPVKTIAMKGISVNPPPSQKPDEVLTPVDKPASVTEMQRHTLVGHISIEGGLAFNSTTRLIVYRELEGVPQEIGRYWLSDASFQIEVSELKGFLVGQLISENMGLLGRGEIGLSTYKVTDRSTDRISSIELKLLPVHEGLTGQIVDENSFEDHLQPVGQAQINAYSTGSFFESKRNGEFTDTSALENSSIFYKINKAKHWGTFWLARSCEYNRVPMISRKKVESLLEQINYKDDLSNTGIVWGRVFVDGKPIAGATVDLSGMGYVQPTYFNGYFADPNLSSTGTGGLFAFVGVPNGIYAVKARWHGQEFPVQILPVEKGFVSFIEIQPFPVSEYEIHAFDLFSNKPIPARVYVSSTGETYQLDYSGLGRLPLPEMRTLLVVEAQGDDRQAPIRVYPELGDPVVQLPFIETSWINSIKISEKINEVPDSGIVIGLMNHQKGFVDLWENSSNALTQIVYFTEGGSITDDYRLATGFIIFNLPLGVQNISLITDDRNHVQYKAVLIDQGFISIVDFGY